MSTYIPRPESSNRYDDGIALDYASMIRMWSAFDRSIMAFNRECGVIVPGRVSEKRSVDYPKKRRSR